MRKGEAIMAGKRPQKITDADLARRMIR